MKWEKKSLDELGTLQRGRSRHRPRDASFLYGGSYPFVQTGDVKHANLYINSFTQTYSEEGLAQSRLWRKGTLCITIAANIADTAILDIDACFPDSIIGFVPYEGKSNVFFVKYLISTLQRQMKQIAQGAAQDNLSLEKLRSVKFSVPSFEAQESIASILSTYDNLIENNLKRIKLLEETSQLLYRQWFVDFKFPGYEKTKFSKGIPEGWEEKPLSEVCNLTMGQSPKSEFYNQESKGLPFHQGVTHFGSRFVTHETYCTQENRIAAPGDILCSVRAPVGRLNISLDKIIIGRGLSAIRNKEGSQSFQYYQLKNYFFQENIIGSGSIFASVTKKQMETIPLLTPTSDILEKFEGIVNRYDKQIINLFYQNQQLKEARDLLLPRLMEGSIEV